MAIDTLNGHKNQTPVLEKELIREPETLEVIPI